MLACTDVHYTERGALGACLFFSSWSDEKPASQKVVRQLEVAEYRPGHFYERELPVLLELLQGAPPLETIIIDGYVFLGSAGEKGLGAHLYEALGRTVPVVGVAKTAYQGSGFAQAVLRGEGKRPLYVTAAGLEPHQAANLVRAMHGPFRVPTLLGAVDRLSRTG